MSFQVLIAAPRRQTGFLRPSSSASLRSLGRVRTSVGNDVPVHMKLIVDELSELEEKIERATLCAFGLAAMPLLIR